jgi:tetratricopeptide (TPR) repeat protein
MIRLAFLMVLFTGFQAAAQKQMTAMDSSMVKEFFFAGLRDKTNENYAQALDDFNKITVLNPANAAAHYETGFLQLKLDKIPEAEVAINKALNLEPKNKWYLALLTEVYKAKGDMNALIKLYSKLIDLFPEQESNYLGRSGALAYAGRLQESLDSYDELEHRFGTSEKLLKAKNYLKARLKDTSKNRLQKESYLTSGSLMLQKGMPDSALALFKKGKLEDPKGYELDIAIADAYLSLNKVPEASAHLKSALTYKTDDPKLLALYGDLLFRQGNLAGALVQYQSALKLTDQLYYIWEHIVNIHQLMGAYPQAIESANSALSIYPNQAILYYYLAFAQHRTNANVAALPNIKTALQLDGDNNELKALVSELNAEILLDSKNSATANSTFEQALTYSPDNNLIRNNYAYYLAYKGVDLDRANQLIDVISKRFPENEAIANTYAYVLLKKGDFLKAKTWCLRALQNNGQNNAVYLEQYGDVLFLSGDKEGAVIQWLKAQTAGSKSSKLKEKINEKKYIK